MCGRWICVGEGVRRKEEVMSVTHTHIHTHTHTHTLHSVTSAWRTSRDNSLPPGWPSDHHTGPYSSWNIDLGSGLPSLLVSGSMLCPDPILYRQPSRCRPYVSHRWHCDWSLQENVMHITAQVLTLQECIMFYYCTIVASLFLYL